MAGSPFDLPSLGPCRRRVRTTALAAHARAQAGGEDNPGADCAQRKATAHPADVLRRQPAARRAHEGAAGGDDRLEPAGHPRVVSEQALQGQEEVDSHEAATAAATQRQGGEVLVAAGRRLEAAAAFQGLFLGRTRRSWTPHVPWRPHLRRKADLGVQVAVVVGGTLCQ